MKFKNKYIMKDTISYIFLTIGAIIISLQCSVNPLRNGNSGTDSGVFRYMAYAMKQGLVMYKDSFDHKGPIIYWINYLGMSISSWRGVWVIELITIASSIVITYQIARLFHRRSIALLINFMIWSMIFELLGGGNYVEEYALPFIALSTYIYIDYFYNNRVNLRKVILCGMSFSMVFLLRANMAGLWVIFCCVIFLEKVVKREWKQLGKFIICFMLGSSIVILPCVLYLVTKGAFSDFINQYFIFNMVYSKQHQSNFTNAVIEYLQYPIFSISFLVLILAILKGKKEEKYFNVVYFCCLIFVYLLTFMSGKNYGHYAMILIPMTVYPMCILLSNTKVDDYCLWIIMVYVFVISVIPFWRKGIVEVLDCYTVKDSDFKGESIESILSVIEHNSEENDLITVYGNKNSIYVLSNRLSASKYSYQFPIGSVNPDILEEYFQELEEVKPQLVVIDREMDNQMEQFLEKSNYTQISNIEGCNVWKYK